MIMKKKRKIVMIILLLSILLVLILMGLFIEFNGRNTNNNEVEIVSSMIEIQKEKELEFNTKGYSIDNPNVILNPYGNSPLTALILFETKEKVSPTITIKGKDELSTFTHTFKSSKKHYLKVYGLYADYENDVVIEYTKDDELVSKSIVIKTDKLPDNMVLPTNVYADKSNLGNDLYFFTPSSAGYGSV